MSEKFIFRRQIMLAVTPTPLTVYQTTDMSKDTSSQEETSKTTEVAQENIPTSTQMPPEKNPLLGRVDKLEKRNQELEKMLRVSKQFNSCMAGAFGGGCLVVGMHYLMGWHISPILCSASSLAGALYGYGSPQELSDDFLRQELLNQISSPQNKNGIRHRMPKTTAGLIE